MKQAQALHDHVMRMLDEAAQPSRMQVSVPQVLCSLLEAICRLLQRVSRGDYETQMVILLEEVRLKAAPLIWSHLFIHEAAVNNCDTGWPRHLCCQSPDRSQCMQAYKAACKHSEAREELLLFATRYRAGHRHC